MKKLTTWATGMRWISNTMRAHATPNTARGVPLQENAREQVDVIDKVPPASLYQKNSMSLGDFPYFIPFVVGAKGRQSATLERRVDPPDAREGRSGRDAPHDRTQ